MSRVVATKYVRDHHSAGRSNRSTSIVVTPPPSREITPHALFCNVVLPDGSHAQPEIYPRPDGTLYVCGAGMSDKAPIPDRAADVVYSEEGVERLRERLDVVMRKEWIEEAFISGNVVKQACYRPDSDKTGKPVIGNIGNGCVRSTALDSVLTEILTLDCG